uniref:Aminotransferase class I/classII large domain-containing protein n=1 Tax=Chromera velia CCMP2878 TaxID=1169474 RepID=A0A0G4GIJ7_9ALVE|eukprot:Cvel_21996.t1-p1 / transcript=Cvel_21996.t1 / gene=Cvel_21996 / organism=Chromera_velia_CCMP2878 / gene_product=Putative 8-amino-7-oxononanoate synthase, putative / transcript_product=Putative 8-amino-7-oxononanoate synthase, putative / location=Cvel_scaffold2119:22068-23387(+) / protein_length=440 / sequence_SO=supercontig / SO=protein_coding / is_pseudo=false
MLDVLRDELERRKERGLLRQLSVPPPNSADFSSNDYLGFAQSFELESAALEEYSKARLRFAVSSPSTCRLPFVGSSGSRLLTGNNEYVCELEEWLCTFHKAPAALVFNSGFDCNLGLFGSLCISSEDVVVFDSDVHNSVREGLRLSRGSSVSFLHNDLKSLRERLREARVSSERRRKSSQRGREGFLVVAIESIYSMDGSVAPLREILGVCAEYGALLVVDEAHSTGVVGVRGEGLVVAEGLENHPSLLARVHTFGKALGAHGAVLLGPPVLCQFLLNYARPLVYSTALPLHSLCLVKAAYSLLSREALVLQRKLKRLTAEFQSQAVQTFQRLEAKRRHSDVPPPSPVLSDTQVQAILVSGNKRVVWYAEKLRPKGFDVRPIRSPTVPKGTERLRVVLHAHNHEAEVRGLWEAVSEVWEEERQASTRSRHEKTFRHTARL